MAKFKVHELRSKSKTELLNQVRGFPKLLVDFFLLCAALVDGLMLCECYSSPHSFLSC